MQIWTGFCAGRGDNASQQVHRMCGLLATANLAPKLCWPLPRPRQGWRRICCGRSMPQNSLRLDTMCTVWPRVSRRAWTCCMRLVYSSTAAWTATTRLVLRWLPSLEHTLHTHGWLAHLVVAPQRISEVVTGAHPVLRVRARHASHGSHGATKAIKVVPLSQIHRIQLEVWSQLPA